MKIKRASQISFFLQPPPGRRAPGGEEEKAKDPVQKSNQMRNPTAGHKNSFVELTGQVNWTCSIRIFELPIVLPNRPILTHLSSNRPITTECLAATLHHHQQEEEEQQAPLGAGCARDVHSQLTVGLLAMYLLT